MRRIAPLPGAAFVQTKSDYRRQAPGVRPDDHDSRRIEMHGMRGMPRVLPEIRDPDDRSPRQPGLNPFGPPGAPRNDA